MNVYDSISSNKRNSVLLFLFFFIIIVGMAYTVGFYYNSSPFGIFIAVFAAIFSIGFSLLQFYIGDKIVLGISKAKPADKKDHAKLINVVEGLSIAAGIPIPKIYVINDSAINAFATGRDPNHASVAVTAGAIERLNKVELEGVVAHELSHVKNYDIRMMMLVAVLVGIIALISDIFLRSMIYGKKDSDNKIGGTLGLILLFVGIVFAALSPLIAQLIKFAVSRKREFLADSSGALLTRYPKGLADALRKIRDDKEPLVDSANKATAHLFIENPLRSFKGKMNRLFSTHPPIDERIKALDSM